LKVGILESLYCLHGPCKARIDRLIALHRAYPSHH
jgi:hypothetical protein